MHNDGAIFAAFQQADAPNATDSVLWIMQGKMSLAGNEENRRISKIE